jgi:alpha-L-fucosidase
MKRRTLLKNLALTLPALAASKVVGSNLLTSTPNEDMPFAKGKFQPTWESLSQYEVPEWFKNAKFGIWAHWGPQCQPEAGDWYARSMYMQGDNDYKFHLAKYGHPSKFGFKDVINEWKADQWNPEELLAKYKKAGAKYFVALANHHDNFDNWNSKYQPWNATRIGPKKDLIGGWEKATRNQGLKFGVSIHASRPWTWYEVAQGSDSGGVYDGNLTKKDGKGLWWEGLDPQELYAQKHPLSTEKNYGKLWHWENGANPPSEAYIKKFVNRTFDLIKKYNPELVYFDDNVMPYDPINKTVGLQIAAHIYNQNIQRNGGKLEAVMNTKGLDEMQRKCVVWDVERGHSNIIEPNMWQTDTCIGTWHYSREFYEKGSYKTPKTVIHTLIDVVSKNGNLLLNIPLRGNGSMDEKEAVVVEGITEWMAKYSDCIYDTRPWKIYGEGPAIEGLAVLKGHGFNEGKGKTFTGEDIRFTTKGGAVYAMPLGSPTDGKVLIKSLKQGSEHFPQNIAQISLVGTNQPLEFMRNQEGVTVKLPDSVTNEFAFALRIS